MRACKCPTFLAAAGSLFAGILLACSDEDRIWSHTLGPVAILPPTAISPVSGTGQQSRAGERLAEPLMVRVTDSRHQGLAGVPVTWTVVSEEGRRGRFLKDNGERLDEHPTVRTNGNGLAEVFFEPIHMGPYAIAATIEVDQATLTARFTASAVGVLIELWQPWNVFTGPDDSDDVEVFVGTPVEWIPRYGSARIVSTSAPAEGGAFDSGPLEAGERFLFVPDVAGTWEFMDEVHGATGSLIVWEPL